MSWRCGLEDASPRVIVTATCGIEPGKTLAYMPIVAEAIAQSSAKPESVVVLERPEMAFEPVAGRGPRLVRPRSLC